MALTREEILQRVSKRLEVKFIREISWQDLVASIGGLTPGERNDLLSFIIEGKDVQVGKLLRTLLQSKVREAASSRAEAMLLGNRLTVDDLGDLL